jgi:tRNA G18 (ribose-2'-O)-methylase SpoU
MARLVEVEDPTDPRLADYANLRDVQLRRSLEAEHGLFLAEGEKVVRRAVEAGFPVRSFLLAPRWLDGLRDVLHRTSDVPCYVATEAVIEAVTGFHVHRGALASLRRPPPQSVTDVVVAASHVLVLEDLVDHTNVGAIFRCAAAFGIDAILLSPRCADPLYRRAIKVSMGAVFLVPYARMAEWYGGLIALREIGFQVLALTPAPDAVDLTTLSREGKVALVLGSEGPGITPRWLRSADVQVTIPMKRHIDSLNVAAAAAIACFVLSQER